MSQPLRVAGFEVIISGRFWVTAKVANPRGVVLIDEIEDGIYYKNMPDVWRSLITLCLREDVQLIVSTHSYEFLQAAAPILAREEIAKESQLLRAEIDEKGKYVIRKIPAQALDAATRRDFEVR
jgi:AAA15 family ATPase/GTPase